MQRFIFLLMVSKGHRLSAMERKLFTARQVACLLVEKQGPEKPTPEFAAEIGVTAQCIRDIYRGHSNPGNKVLNFLGLKRVRKSVLRYERKR